MASKLVVDAVENRLAAMWSHTPVIGLNTVGETPADGTSFLTVQYPVATEEPASVGSPGSNVFREEGGFWLVLSVPRGQGLGVPMTWIDELRAMFRAKQFGGVNCVGASPAYQDDNIENGAYVRLSSVITYYADILG